MIVSHDLTILSMILNASIVVKVVMALLVLASMLSWTYIFMKMFAIRRARRQADESSASSGAAPTWWASTSAPPRGATPPPEWAHLRAGSRNSSS